MIVTIRVTEAAIEWLKSELHIDEEQAEEIAQMVINLCEKSFSFNKVEKLEEGEGSEVRLRKCAEEVLSRYKWMVNNPGAPIAGLASFEGSLKRLEQALEEGEEKSS